MAAFASSSSVTISSSPTMAISNIANLAPIKLNKYNYVLWKSLWLPILYSFNLLSLVDGSNVLPSEFITTSDDSGLSVLNSNPNFTDWARRDQILLIWLNATISENLLVYVVGLPTSEILWRTLERRFSTISRSHVMQLKSRLQPIKKNSDSITDYLQHIKQIVDNLAALGSTIDDEDVVFNILNGLPAEFDAFTTSIRVRSTPITSDDLHGLLLSEELSLET
ncbi:hypothetical protein GIB67_015769 [Kingdonia uniflora]|uniref:Retrovirus-related Pol polyprotein from transposon TNT 1-94 n=1 Tax=Kingdonia uniflora TaxID=39325 RepID=A0A7J7NUE5_9MAGN|nr:hypothetical protein GIB67_015769 [Kingdonia uniflora]